MGQHFKAICKRCGFSFDVNEGGGFLFHSLHCKICGKEKNINISKLDMPHNSDISNQEKNKIVEENAGKCECGGQYLIDAQPRCPECHSDD